MTIDEYKEYQRKYQEQYRKRNRQKISEYMKDYYKKNKNRFNRYKKITNKPIDEVIQERKDRLLNSLKEGI